MFTFDYMLHTAYNSIFSNNFVICLLYVQWYFQSLSHWLIFYYVEIDLIRPVLLGQWPFLLSVHNKLIHKFCCDFCHTHHISHNIASIDMRAPFIPSISWSFNLSLSRFVGPHPMKHVHCPIVQVNMACLCSVFIIQTITSTSLYIFYFPSDCSKSELCKKCKNEVVEFCGGWKKWCIDNGNYWHIIDINSITITFA